MSALPLPAMLLPQAAADTVVALTSSSTLETVEGIAEIIIAGTVLLLIAGLAIAVLGLRKRVNALVDDARHRLDPITERANNVAANVEYLSAVLREDVRMVHDSARAVSDRLQQASDRMEERIEDFNALMEVVQEQAEGAFLDTAATAHGVREGMRHLQDGESGGRRPAARPSGLRPRERKGAATPEARRPAPGASPPAAPPEPEEGEPPAPVDPGPSEIPPRAREG